MHLDFGPLVEGGGGVKKKLWTLSPFWDIFSFNISICDNFSICPIVMQIYKPIFPVPIPDTYASGHRLSSRGTISLFYKNLPSDYFLLEKMKALWNPHRMSK